MSTLVITNNQQVVTTSLTVAETFGKQHRHVLESIDDLITGVAEKSADLFREDVYEHPQNKQLELVEGGVMDVADSTI